MKISKHFAWLRWLAFVALSFCTSSAACFGQDIPFVLHGQAVMADGPHNKWITLHKGTIVRIADDEPVTVGNAVNAGSVGNAQNAGNAVNAVNKYEFDGYIYPGF